MNNIAYTLGATKSYDRALVEETNVTKIGYRSHSAEWPGGYEGGWVWATWDEANQYWLDHREEVLASYTATDFSVYELQLPAQWDRCVLMHSDGVHRLRLDAIIVRKVTAEER